MKSITDKELLTFCNLTNLKMEFAKLKYKRYDSKTRIDKEVNHTIYTLIQAEIEGQNKRKELLIEQKQNEIEELEFIYNCRIKDPSYDKYGDNQRDLSDDELKEKINKERVNFENKMKKIEDDNVNVGVFLRKQINPEKTTFVYNKSNDFRKLSPILMEYYDRYSESNEETKFLNEWELIYSGDSYEIGKTLIIDILDKSGIKDSRREKILKEIPSREKVEEKALKENEKKLTLTFPEYLDYFSTITGIEPVEGILKGLNAKKISRIKEKAEEYGIDLKQCIIDYLSNKYINDNEKREELNSILNKYEAKNAYKFEENGVKIVVLRKKEEYVIAFENKTGLLSIDEQLDNGVIPEEAWQVKKIIEYLKEKYGNEISLTFTGVKRAGKLATICGILDSTVKQIRPFYIDKPLNIGTLVDFTEKDISEKIEGIDYLNSWEIYERGMNIVASEMALVVGNILYKLIIKRNVLSATNLLKPDLTTFVITMALGLLDFMKMYRDKKLLEDYISFLIEEQIIDGRTENGKHYFSEKILGKVNGDIFTKDYQIGNVTLNLRSYLQVKSYEMIKNYKVVELNETDTGNSRNQKIELVSKINEKDYRKLTLLIKEKEILKITNETFLQGLDSYLAGGDNYMQVGYAPENRDENDLFGSYIYDLLELFFRIQENYEKINHKAFYVENDKIESFEKLSLKVEEQSSDKSKAQSEYYYLPHILEDGNLEKEVSTEYIGSFLRSIYSSNNDYYDLTSTLVRGKETHFFETTKKGDLINRHLLAKMKGFKKFPHYENVISQVEQKPSILEEFYEIETQNKKSGTIKIGLLDSNKKFDKNKIAYSYDQEDKITTKIIEVPVFFSSVLDDDDENDTNEALDGAILKCSEGTAPLELKVLSQNFMETKGLLNATVADYEGNKSIIPKGTLCNKMKKSGNPQPCAAYISTEEWKPGSKGVTINDNPVLLATCKCKCAIGGTISIVDSKGIITIN